MAAPLPSDLHYAFHVETSLDDWFAEAHKHGPEYRDGLSSHLTMSLVALTRLGAGAAQREAFARAYLARLERETWVDAHGFRAALDAREPYALVRELLEQHGEGLPGAAGHGLLRVYFALEAEELLSPRVFRDELARALAYFVDTATRLGGGIERRGTTPLAQALAGAEPLTPDELAPITAQNMITSRQLAVAGLRRFAAIVERAAPRVDWAEVLPLFARIGVHNPNFTLMHALTTAHALVELEARLPGLDVAPLQRGWIDFAAASWLTESLRAPDSRGGDPLPRPRSDEILRRVFTSLDDHAPKAAFSLSRLEARFGDPALAAAAAALVARWAGPEWS
jgi:hypothetical protein